MRLKFKPQSTFYTCNQATQAIALNTFLGTDYRDLDVVANNNYGYHLGFSIIMLAEDLVRRKLDPTVEYHITHHQLAEGMQRVLRTQRKLPTYEEAIQAYIELSMLQQQNYATNLREHPFILSIGHGTSESVKLTSEEAEESIRRYAEDEERERIFLKSLEKDETTRRFYYAFVNHLDEELLKPINYRFSTDVEHDDFSGVTNLSNGRLVVEPVDAHYIVDRTQRGEIVIFGAHRRELGLTEYSQRAGHSWIVDRVEGDRLVLLDTNHQVYGHGPEVSITLSQLSEAQLSLPIRIH